MQSPDLGLQSHDGGCLLLQLRAQEGDLVLGRVPVVQLKLVLDRARS